jgi:hypothetical protein
MIDLAPAFPIFKGGLSPGHIGVEGIEQAWPASSAARDVARRTNWRAEALWILLARKRRIGGCQNREKPDPFQR